MAPALEQISTDFGSNLKPNLFYIYFFKEIKQKQLAKV